MAGKTRFFGAVPGGYGEGDRFLAVRVPVLRRMARAARGRAGLDDVEQLLLSSWHEVRLLGGLLLVDLYGRDAGSRGAAVRLMLDQADRLDNWDLVDSVAPHVLGPWLVDHPQDRTVLDRFMASDSVWRRRIALLATFALIRAGSFDDTLRLAENALTDGHDLIHKAAGWMLREVGVRDRALLDRFLDQHAARMPRVMLRYSLEKHSPSERARHLSRR